MGGGGAERGILEEAQRAGQLVGTQLEDIMTELKKRRTRSLGSVSGGKM